MLPGLELKRHVIAVDILVGDGSCIGIIAGQAIRFLDDGANAVAARGAEHTLLLAWACFARAVVDS